MVEGVSTCCCGAPQLTGRQVDVLCHAAAGHSNATIAEQLMISPHTAAYHIQAMMRRAGAANRTELIARAFAAQVLACGSWPPRPTRRRCLRVLPEMELPWPQLQLRAWGAFPPTRRQAEVLRLVGTGLDDAAIAEALGISRHTASHHLHNLLESTGAASRCELVARGFAATMLMPGTWPPALHAQLLTDSDAPTAARA